MAYLHKRFKNIGITCDHSSALTYRTSVFSQTTTVSLGGPLFNFNLFFKKKTIPVLPYCHIRHKEFNKTLLCNWHFLKSWLLAIAVPAEKYFVGQYRKWVMGVEMPEVSNEVNRAEITLISICKWSVIMAHATWLPPPVALTQKFSKDTGSDCDLNPACADGN